MNVFLDLASVFALKLRTIVGGFVTFFLIFFLFYGHRKIGAMMVYDHRFLIIAAPTVLGICFLYFGHLIKKMEGE